MPGVEDTLKIINDSITEFKTGFNSFKSELEAKAKGQDERIGSLEKNLRESLIKDTGPREMPKNKWSWGRVCLAIASKDWSVAPFEKEECDKWREKTMQAGTFAAGGSLIPEQYVAELITLLRNNLVMDKIGVRMLTGLQGSPVVFPKITSGLTGYWIAEGSAPTASDLGTGRLELQPRKAGALVKISNDLRLLNNPSVEAAVRSDIVLALQTLIEVAMFAGTGLLGQPIGIDNWTPAVNSSTWATANSPGDDINSFKDMIYQVDLDNALMGNGKFAFVTTPGVYWTFLAKLVAATTLTPIYPPEIVSTIPKTFAGYPIVTTGNCPSGTAYFGNWDDLLCGMWDTMSIASSDTTSTAFQNDELWIRAIVHLDFAIRREVSICRMASIA